jgi:hypothetical protein
MKKKAQSTDDRKLMDRLAPDPALGRLLGILATTYEMQPEFFETDFLPTLLGLGAWDDRSWTSRIALEKHLAELEASSVLLDARPYRGRPRSLRVEVEPVFLHAGRILHAKVLVRVYEEAVCFIFGSANLTEPGYRRNREIAVALTASAKHPTDSQIVRGALHGLRPLLKPWITPSAGQLCDLAEERLNEWAGGASEQEQWFAWGGGAEPLWRQVIERWPSHDHVERVTIVSPFWSEELDSGPVTKFVAAMRDLDGLAANAELRLLTEAAPDKQGTYKPKLPESFAKFDAGSIGVSAVAFAVDPRVPPEEVGMGDAFTGTRSLHAKVVLLEGMETSLAYFGSANFTERGWGFLPDPERANIEAGLIVRRTGNARKTLRSLIPPTIGEPVPLAGAAAGRLAPLEPSPEELIWPGFLREVLLAPSEVDPNQLGLVVVIEPKGIHGSWRIGHLPIEDGPPQVPLLVHDVADSTSAQFCVSLEKSQLERLLRDQEVHVKWWCCEEGRSFPVNVVAESKTALPISPGTGRPEEQHLIAYYQGRITWEDLFPDPEGDAVPATTSQDQDEHSSVDTSRIQSYIVREFVEALKGITDDLKGAAQSPKACMRLALLGSVSPVALARRVLEAAESAERSATASGFQLVEILGCLDAARSFPASSRFVNDWADPIHEAVQTVANMLEALQRRFPDELAGHFQRYAQTVRQHYQEKASVK